MSTLPRRSRSSGFYLSRAMNQRQPGICVEEKSSSGKATTPSTRSASTIRRRISPFARLVRSKMVTFHGNRTEKVNWIVSPE